MTFLWLLVWLLSATPSVHVSHPTNGWAVALVVCLLIDLFGSLDRSKAK